MSSNQPIIIKKKRKGGGGHAHHGGAWKVAYADFVTAMMAFFMLMWLLNATTEQQRKGLADYFAPTIPLSPVSGGGHGPFGGDDVTTEDILVQNGQGASLLMPSEARQAQGSAGVDISDEAREEEDATFETVDARLMGRSGESFVSDLDARHVVTRITDEGLVVELFDLPGAPLIDGGEPTGTLIRILGAISGAFQLVDNSIEVRGHVAARPVVALGPSPWRTTAERSDLVRGELGAAGTDEARFRRLAGHGDRQPAVPDPMAVRNSRVEIVLLRNEI